MTGERITDYDNINVQGSIQSSTQGKLVGSFEQMPTAQQKYVGYVVVFTGTTDANYVNNRSYECKEVSTGVYQWVDVTPSQLLNLTQNRAVISDNNGDLASSQVTSTELGYLSGVTSDIQTQIGALDTQITGKQKELSSANAGNNITITGSGDNVVISAQSQIGTQWGLIGGDIADQADLNSTFQKSITGGASTITTSDLTADKALVSNSSGKVQVSSVTQTELGYVSGVTSAIQTQFGDIQDQIDALVSKSDVVDIVQTYSDLESYDTTQLGNNDIVKVLSDSTHSGQESYYRWELTTTETVLPQWSSSETYAVGDVVRHNNKVYTCLQANTNQEPPSSGSNTYWSQGAWIYIGSLSASYTKAETDTLLLGKADTDLTNVTVNSENSGKYLKVTQQGAITYDIPTTDISGKADTNLGNVNVGSGNSGKFVQVKSDGTLQYSNVDMSSKANTGLDNVQVSTDNSGKYLKVTAQGGITYDVPTTDISGKANVQLDNINVGTGNQSKIPQVTSQGGFQYIAIDSSLSNSSTNPVQNSAIYGKFNEQIVKNVELNVSTQTQPYIDVTLKNLATATTSHSYLNLYSYLANVGFTNIQIDTANAGKYLYVDSDGSIQYGTPVTDISGKADVDLTNVNVGDTNQGTYLYVNSSGGIAYATLATSLSDSSTVPVQNSQIYSQLNNQSLTLANNSTGQTDITLSSRNYAQGTTSANTLYVSKKDLSNTNVGSTNSGKYVKVHTDGTLTYDTPPNTTYSAGTGLALSGTTFNHSNSVTANTTGIGSTTAVPVIKYDQQGHITEVSTATIYPPTTQGTSGQYWKSDGSGAGVWQTLDTTPTQSSGNAITSGAVKTALGDGSVTKVGTADVGTDTKPIKLVGGVPTAVTNDLVDTASNQYEISGRKAFTPDDGAVTCVGTGTGSNRPFFRLRMTAIPDGSNPSSTTWGGLQYVNTANKEIGSVTFNRGADGNSNIHLYVKNTSNNNASFKFINEETTGDAYATSPSRAYNSSNTSDVVTIGSLQASTDVVHTAGNETALGIKTMQTLIVGEEIYGVRYSATASGWKEIFKIPYNADFSSVSMDLHCLIVDKSNGVTSSVIVVFRTSTSYRPSLTADNQTVASRLCMTVDTQGNISIWYNSQRVTAFANMLERANSTAIFNVTNIVQVGTANLGSNKPVESTEEAPTDYFFVVNSGCAFVDTTSAQTIDGAKTFTENLMVNKDTPIVSLKNTKHTLGNAPSSNSNAYFRIQDNAGTECCRFAYRYSTGLQARASILSYNTHANEVVDTAEFHVFNEYDGNKYMTGPSRNYNSSNTDDVVTIGMLNSAKGTAVGFASTQVSITESD